MAKKKQSKIKRQYFLYEGEQRVASSPVASYGSDAKLYKKQIVDLQKELKAQGRKVKLVTIESLNSPTSSYSKTTVDIGSENPLTVKPLPKKFAAFDFDSLFKAFGAFGTHPLALPSGKPSKKRTGKKNTAKKRTAKKRTTKKRRSR